MASEVQQAIDRLRGRNRNTEMDRLVSNIQNEPKAANAKNGQIKYDENGNVTKEDKDNQVDTIDVQREAYEKGLDGFDQEYLDQLDADRNKARDNQFTATMQLDTSNVPEKNINQLIDERFKRQFKGSRVQGTDIESFLDNETGETITPSEKENRASQMQQEAEDKAKAVDQQPPAEANGIEGAIDNVANGSKDLSNRDFSDDFADYMNRSGLGMNTGQFMFEGDMDQWRNFISDEIIRDYYSDMFNPDGTLDNEKFENWYTDSKAKTWNDVMTPDGAYYNADNILGSDYDTITDIFGYLYDTDDNFGYDNLQRNSGVSQDDRQAVIDALAYEYMANEATKAMSDGYQGNFAQRFSVDDINRFLKNDAFEIGSRTDNSYLPAGDDYFNNPDANILMTNAYNEYIPVQGAIDNILAALGQGYGAKKRAGK